MNEKVDANEVIAVLQSEIADKALTIALLKSRLKEKEAKETQTPETKPADVDQHTEGDAE